MYARLTVPSALLPPPAPSPFDSPLVQINTVCGIASPYFLLVPTYTRPWWLRQLHHPLPPYPRILNHYNSHTHKKHTHINTTTKAEPKTTACTKGASQKAAKRWQKRTAPPVEHARACETAITNKNSRQKRRTTTVGVGHKKKSSRKQIIVINAVRNTIDSVPSAWTTLSP